MENPTGIRKTFREIPKPSGNSQNPEGKQKTLREFVKPSGNSQNPTGCCKKTVWSPLFKFFMMI